jgi:hypothetical protein
VSESAHLLGMLRRIRRRARALAALEGAVAGAALGLAALALGAALWRARGGLAPRRLDVVAGGVSAAAGVFAGVFAILGGVLAGARRISLVRCARLLDAALDRGGRASDRVLSALSFIDEREGPLARAALADAVARARALEPALVAPARRPRALPALGGATLALVIVAGWPASAPGARRDAGPTVATTAEEPRLHVAAGALEAERAELGAAATAAEAAGDVSLAALAREARAMLDTLADGALGRGEALDRLTTLAARAREAADETDAEQAALRAAGKALEATAATRALGKALGADAPDATDRALRDLAARAEATAGARADIAGAMRAAAGGVTSTAAETTDGAEPGGAQRHLNRERDAAGGGVGDAAPTNVRARQLERLRRDLEDTASACRGDAAACAKRLDGGAREQPNGLRGLAREARQASARRRLENAVAQLRERLRRGELEESARGGSERRFARVARGERRDGQPGGEARAGEPGGRAGSARGAEGQQASAEDPAAGEGGNEGTGEGSENNDDVFADESETSGATSASAGPGASGDGAGAARGEGAGRKAGGEPLGRGSLPSTRGREREVRVRSGAGPTRSEIIESSARRGFAVRDYVRVFDDYQPVVEESLATGAVPEGRRYVVRRYFQLIRPRAHTPRTAASGTP